MKLDKSYDLYMVKRNDGKTLRLTNLDDILHHAKDPNFWDIQEAEVVGVEKEYYMEDFVQQYKTIWWSPTNNRYWEATILDKAAQEETKLAIDTIQSIPDSPNKHAGTLVKLIGTGEKGVYHIVDGTTRTNRRN